MENYFFLKNYVSSEGATSHNVLNHQSLPITRHQEGFVLIIILSHYQYCLLPLILFVSCEEYLIT